MTSSLWGMTSRVDCVKVVVTYHTAEVFTRLQREEIGWFLVTYTRCMVETYKECARAVLLGVHVVTLDSDAATLLSVRPLSVKVFWEERRRAALAVAR